MNYLPVLKECEDSAVGASIADALGQLFTDPSDLRSLTNDTQERTIAEILARYLRPHFGQYEINVDYNRMGDQPKEVAWRVGPGAGRDQVFPDIIVHRRFHHDHNLLAIELKKDSNRQSKEDDLLKLKAYRTQLHYRHALFIRLGVGKTAGTVSECEWVSI
jgi:hypothetical protein